MVTTLQTDDLAAVKAFRALGDPVRYQIVRMLVEHGELGCGDFGAAFGLSPSALSHHTRILQECGLIVMRKEGTHHFFRVQSETLARFAPQLASSPTKQG